MLKEFKTKTNLGVGFGAVLQLLGLWFIDSGETLAVLGIICLIVGTILLVWGCANYSKAKGHSGILGILGLVSLIGLIMLVFLPDRYKDGKRPETTFKEKNINGETDYLERLYKLKEQGAITAEEFEKKKKEVLP